MAATGNSTSPGGNTGGALSLQIQSLTQAIKALDGHVQAIGNGQSGQAPDISTPPGSSIAERSTTSGQAQQALNVAAQQQSTEQSIKAGGINPSASMPKDDPQTEEQQAIRAMTWNELGGLGGPLGRFQKRQYVAQQYSTNLGKMGNYLNYQDAQGNPIPMTDAEGNVVTDEEGNTVYQTPGALRGALGTAANWAGNTLSSHTTAAGIGLGVGAGLESAYLLGSGWTQAGTNLGYGQRIGIPQMVSDILSGNLPQNASAAMQGASLALESQELRAPVGTGIGAGLTGAQASEAVQTLAGLGFANQGGIGLTAVGDNAKLAQRLVAPLMQQGVSAQGAADWTEALRNANDTIPNLTASLQGMNQAAQAAKVTTDQYNTALLDFATQQTQSGGTMGQGAQTGMAFTEATGMLPSVLGTIQNNPVYQGLMMGMTGTLPSNIGNLTPGQQLQGVQEMLNLYGSGLGGLDRNRYENVGGVKVISSYGSSAEAAQIAQMTGLTQSQVMRLMNEFQGKNMNNMIDVLNKVGNQNAGGGLGSGLWQILDRSNQWKTLSGHDKELATRAWNQGIAPELSSILNRKEIRQIDKTHDIRTRANLLQKDLLGNQKNNPYNKIQGQVNVKIDASTWLKRMFRISGTGQVKLNSNAGGTAPNNVMNGPLGDSMIANNAMIPTGP